MVAANKIVAMISPDSAPVRRVVSESRERGLLIDATYGRRTRTVIVAESGHVVLSAIAPETIAGRVRSEGEPGDE
jgi:regulator of extracellular matrix RemA (YlzA/DUF370 family)